MLAAVTGWGGEMKDKRSAEYAGVDPHFTKPVGLDMLEPPVGRHRQQAKYLSVFKFTSK